MPPPDNNGQQQESNRRTTTTIRSSRRRRQVPVDEAPSSTPTNALKAVEDNNHHRPFSSSSPSRKKRKRKRQQQQPAAAAAPEPTTTTTTTTARTRNRKNVRPSTTKGSQQRGTSTNTCSHNTEEEEDSDRRRHGTTATNTTNKRSSSSPVLQQLPLLPPVRYLRRRSRQAAVEELAAYIAVCRKRVVMITGAGISVASGIPPFRSTNSHANQQCKRSKTQVTDTSMLKNGPRATTALWNQVVWTTATRKAFAKDPVRWYNEFWIPHFYAQEKRQGSSGNGGSDGNNAATGGLFQPNRGHDALQEIHAMFPDTVFQITQNIDGLQPPGANLIEAHGRVGLYKCCPFAVARRRATASSSDESEDDAEEEEAIPSSDDDLTDDDADRPVQLGHRRKAAAAAAAVAAAEASTLPRTRGSAAAAACPYQYLRSLTARELLPPSVRSALVRAQNRQQQQQQQHQESSRGDDGSTPSMVLPTIDATPICPSCSSAVMPQALLFDEGYHSHAHYQFAKAEDWIASAEVMVFCGTSFSVQLTSVALRHARRACIPVYNFNLPGGEVLQQSYHHNGGIGAGDGCGNEITNILGPANETLPMLAAACRQLYVATATPPPSSAATTTTP